MEFKKDIMINPDCKEISQETLAIIGNLRSMGKIEHSDPNYYITSMLESLRRLHPEETFNMSLIEKYGQEWCLKNGIIGYEYIAKLNLSFRKE